MAVSHLKSLVLFAVLLLELLSVEVNLTFVCFVEPGIIPRTPKHFEVSQTRKEFDLRFFLKKIK